MIRLAVIGYGEHTQAYSAASRRLRGAAFVAAVDADADKAAQTAEALGAPISAGSLDDLLARESNAVDGVLIDSTNGTGIELVEKAAAAGKHVLVETRIALSTQQVDAAIDTCRSAGVRLMVGQATRFTPAATAVKDGLDSGTLGAPGLLRIHRWETPQTVSSQFAELGVTDPVDIVMGRIIRDIDLANWMFEGVPTEVYALRRGQSQADQNWLDYVQVHLGFPEGGMALIDYSQTLPKGTVYFSLSMIAATGAAYADDQHNMNLLYRKDTPSAPLALETGWGQGHVLAQLQEFIDAIEEDREPAISGSDARAAALVVEAVVESMSSGRASQRSGGRYELV